MADISGADSDLADASIGYSKVDAQPQTDLLVQGMDATAGWPAVQRLRAWERARLALRPGERVLDVGCGTGDVAVDLSRAVGESGQVIGIDASEAMLQVAGTRAVAANALVDFRIGDVGALDFPDGAFDACRTERMLQWVPDPGAAVTEIIRVVRPGGRLVLADTDWRTLVIDIPDRAAADLLRNAVLTTRGDSVSTGGRLVNLCRDAGLVEITCSAEAHTWTTWDPDAEFGPAGFFPPRLVIPQIVQAGSLTPAEGERCVDSMVDAGRHERLFMSLTMFAVYGRR